MIQETVNLWQEDFLQYEKFMKRWGKAIVSTIYVFFKNIKQKCENASKRKLVLTYFLSLEECLRLTQRIRADYRLQSAKLIPLGTTGKPLAYALPIVLEYEVR